VPWQPSTSHLQVMSIVVFEIHIFMSEVMSSTNDLYNWQLMRTFMTEPDHQGRCTSTKYEHQEYGPDCSNSCCLAMMAEGSGSQNLDINWTRADLLFTLSMPGRHPCSAGCSATDELYWRLLSYLVLLSGTDLGAATDVDSSMVSSRYDPRKGGEAAVRSRLI
jgi:hypothetical protein